MVSVTVSLVPLQRTSSVGEKEGLTYQFGIDYCVMYGMLPLICSTVTEWRNIAKARFENYKEQPCNLLSCCIYRQTCFLRISSDRRERTGVKAAIIREKGVNGDREMAYSLYLAGFDVKDVHMTDLVNGRETLEDVNMIVYCGGFSNSDVLGSAKGWAGGFLFNEKAKKALDNFYARPDTLSLGICNGCQLMIELGLVNPEDAEKPKMLHNTSHKFESTYLTVAIPENDSVMFKSLEGSKLGIGLPMRRTFLFPYARRHTM